VNVNGRDVAAVFKKRHDHVLRDIDHLLTSPKFAGVVGVVTDYIDKNGASRRSFDMTRDGFALLAMGWTGERALTSKFGTSKRSTSWRKS
jgi:Rha family phage regulatory protein